ncbi:peptidylprolyl isomerase [Solimicrobium silvestre]|uniref:peptidylprolyl isomerase n=1 Tax=Solimicrobium silvestre TaxID=2099400 RepID=A0A2S9H2A8_9BURK|nr:peptidylprolyl isomerase [Solimicrobium silvestre]PRC94098.1 PPIC-type PPIASE domain [Solimicrobium silvestre]
MLIKSRVVLGSAVALMALAACTPKEADKTAAAATSATPAKEVVAATVNGTPISQKQVDMILHQQRGMPDTPETRKMIIDNIAMQLIVAQEAVKKGLDKTADTMDEIEMAKQSVLAQAFVQDYIKHNEVTDAQLATEYDKLKAQASGNQFKARHILVKTEDEAKAIIAKLNKDPKSFEAIAKAQSLDPGSKVKGGDLGWFDAHSMVPEFGAAVAKLEKGKFTEEPVKSQFGYHVIMLDDTRPSTATIPPLEQVKAGLSQQLQQQNLKKMLDDMKAKAKIDIVAAAPAPAAVVPAPAAPAADAVPAAAAPAASTPAAEPAKK